MYTLQEIDKLISQVADQFCIYQQQCMRVLMTLEPWTLALSLPPAMVRIPPKLAWFQCEAEPMAPFTKNQPISGFKFSRTGRLRGFSRTYPGPLFPFDF